MRNVLQKSIMGFGSGPNGGLTTWFLNKFDSLKTWLGSVSSSFGNHLAAISTKLVNGFKENVL